MSLSDPQKQWGSERGSPFWGLCSEGTSPDPCPLPRLPFRAEWAGVAFPVHGSPTRSGVARHGGQRSAPLVPPCSP